MKLTIINRSEWPDWFVRPVCEWIVGRAGITWDYTIELPRISDRSMLAGRGGSRKQRSRIHRRFTPRNGQWPYITKYWTYKWSPSYLLHNRLEAFVDIVSHEACHANAGSPKRFMRDGTCDRSSMEMTCERFSKATVEAFRAGEWAKLRPKVKAAARRHRDKKSAKVIMRISPAPKLDKAAKMLAKWQKKMKLAANKVKKYAKQVRYYEGRVAAKSTK